MKNLSKKDIRLMCANSIIVFLTEMKTLAIKKFNTEGNTDEETEFLFTLIPYLSKNIENCKSELTEYISIMYLNGDK